MLCAPLTIIFYTVLKIKMKTKLTHLGAFVALAIFLAAPNLRAAALTWSASPGTWDVGTTLNWNGGNATFNNGDSAIFSNLGAAGSGASVVTIAGTVLPAATTVSATAANVNYTFSGSGSIGGTGTLLKTGASLLTINTTNSFSGGTTIGGGIVLVNTTAVGQFGTGSITLTNGGALTLYRATTTDDGSTIGSLTNALIVPTGWTGIISNSPRGNISGSLTGGGTLNFRANATRGDITGNWSAFTGQINLTGVTGGNFRCLNAAGYPLAKINLATGSALGNRVAGTPTIPVGEISGDFNSSLIAPNTGSESLSVIWRVGGLNTSATFNGNIIGATSLIKEGSGTWTLGGTNTTFTNTMTVSSGALTLTNTATITNSSVVTVSAGATLNLAGSFPFSELDIYTNRTLKGGGVINASAVVIAAGGALLPGDGVGTLTISNGTFSSAGALTLELNRTNSPATNDQIKATSFTINGGSLIITNLGPDLKAGDSFKLFSVAIGGSGFTTVNLPTNAASGASYTWTNKLAVDGTIQVLTATGGVNTNATNITSIVTGTQLVLSWPTDHIGWHLQAQTNAIGIGLTTNWTSLPSTSTVNSYTNVIDASKGAVFYRMVYP